MKKVVATSISVMLFVSFICPSAIAGQQLWGAAYLDWSGARLSSDSTISQVIQPLEISPKTYWEAGWHWDNVADGGYGGIQSQGILANGSISDLAIFSIWNGLRAVPGEGAGCTPFGGEGIGYSCRLPIALEAGNKYEITFGVDHAKGPQWWIATIRNLKLGGVKVIGSIETTSKDARASNWNNFIEYWGPAVPCDAVGQASAKFYVPSSNNLEVEFSSPKFSRPSNPCAMSAGDTPPPGFIGDAVIRFGGSNQAESTSSMPYTKTKSQIASEKEALDKAAKEKALTDQWWVNECISARNFQVGDIVKMIQSKDKPGNKWTKKELSDFNHAMEVISLNCNELSSDFWIENGAEIKSELSKAGKVLNVLYQRYLKSIPVTISCYKSGVIKKLSGVKPVCPKGFKLVKSQAK